MKTLRNTAMLMMLSAGFAYAQEITVQGDRKLNTDFTKYKTYSWMQTDKPSTQVIAYSYEEVIVPENNTAASTEKKGDRMNKKTDKMDRKADHKMDKADKKARHHGKNDNDVTVYSYFFTVPSADSSMNNTLVNSVEDQLEGRGYTKNDASPDLLVAYKIFDKGTQIKGYNDEPMKINTTEARTSEDTLTYKLKPGTVLISIIDAKKGGVVWEGYASGVAQNNDMINDKARIRQAVNLIFKKYEFRGDKVSMN